MDDANERRDQATERQREALTRQQDALGRQQDAVARQQEMRRPLQLDRHGNMIFQDAAELARFGKRMLESGVMPKHIDSPQRFELMYLRLTRLGVNALNSLQHTYINTKNGQIDIWGPLGLAACMNHPEFEDCIEYLINQKGEQETDANCMTFEPHAAVCIVKRKGREPKVARFTRKRAQEAQLLNKQGTWQNYQFRMLKARARGYALFDAFPDVLEGVAVDGMGPDVPQEQAQDRIVDVQHGKNGEPDTYYRTRHDPSRDKAKQISARFAAKAPEPMPEPEVIDKPAAPEPAELQESREAYNAEQAQRAATSPPVPEEDEEEDYTQRIRKFVQPEDRNPGGERRTDEEVQP